MLARCARTAPACVRFEASYFTSSCLSACTTLTPELSGTDSVPLAPFSVTASSVMVAVTPWGSATGCLATRLIVGSSKSARQATMHRTSPPWPMARACLSVITPFGVETMTVPMPPCTFGSSSLPR